MKSVSSNNGRSNPYLVQVWAVPGIKLDSPLELSGAPNVIIRQVEIKYQLLSTKLSATLLEMDSTKEDLTKDHRDDMRLLGTILTRLAFTFLTPFQVIHARLVPKGLNVGDKFEEVFFNGPPPGIALFESRVGFERKTVLDPSLLKGDLSPEVERAISWFVTGLSSQNPIHRVVSHWTGLETLAPEKRGNWQCNTCHTEIKKCPRCGAATEGIKSVITIKTYLKEELGVDSKEFRRLYRFRNNIIHGELAMDPKGIAETGDKSIKIEQLLLQAIKKALKWPNHKTPILSPKGATIVGVPGLYMSATVPEGVDFYDHP